MALAFDENAHRFAVTPQSPQLGLEFGRHLAVTTLTTGMSIEAVERAAAAGGGLYGSDVVFPAMLFAAECVVLVPAAEAGAPLNARYEFGFVQGIRDADVALDYWGRTAAAGRTTAHWDMPNAFEIDTDPRMVPWTRIAASRYRVARLANPRAFKVTAEFDDHPLLTFGHTVRNAATGQPNHLRWVGFAREFRTVFCVRDKATGAFDPISATEWKFRYNHTVSYADNGARRLVQNAGSSQLPNGQHAGTPSDVGALDRRLLAMARRGGPFFTQQVLAARLASPAPNLTRTDEAVNGDFDPTFWT